MAARWRTVLHITYIAPGNDQLGLQQAARVHGGVHAANDLHDHVAVLGGEAAVVLARHVQHELVAVGRGRDAADLVDGDAPLVLARLAGLKGVERLLGDHDDALLVLAAAVDLDDLVGHDHLVGALFI
jgi:hypothetical protein